MGVKAFELVPAIERVRLMTDKSKAEIECIECCGKNLYLGTTDCFVVHYVAEECTQANGKVKIQCEKQGHKFLGLKKPINQMTATSALNRIIVLCDNTIVLLNMFDLEPIAGGARVKGVSSFCLNKYPVNSNPFSVEIGVAMKKKQIQIYTVTEDRIILHREVATPQLPITLSMDGLYVCMAGTSQYFIINYETKSVQDMFPYNSEVTKPYVGRINKDEFLLSAPNALGMFGTSSLNTTRPPLQWSDNLISVDYSHPYILALNDEFITVHSILDQQQKQSIPFQGGQMLGEFDGRVFVASSKEVYALVPVAIDKQIQALLADKKVKEALDLARNVRKTGLTKDKFQKMYERIQQQAGFIELAAGHLDAARELFMAGRLHTRELLSLYPMMLPSTSTFVRSVPPLHEVADINQLTGGDEDKIQYYKLFLLAYLEDIRETTLASTCQVEVDTALLKLYAETNSPELVSLIASESGISADDCHTWLTKYGRHHALALLYRFKASYDNALAIWTRLITNEIEDESFPGLPFVVEVLANLDDAELVWKYIDQVMEKEEITGVKVFIERPENGIIAERLGEDLVVDYLARFPKAIIIYLEFIVLKKKSQNEKLHTHLAVLYLDRVLKLMKSHSIDDFQVQKARSDLQYMLQTSSLYRVQMLLGKLRETDLYQENAILYGKIEEHDKALRILVHKLKDFRAAERYCTINSRGKDLAYRKRLFQALLNVYLDPTNEQRDNLVGAAVSLLNNNQHDFDILKVLQVLPENWSVGLVSQFVNTAIRGSMTNCRSTHMARMLARSHHLNTKQQHLNMLTDSVHLQEDRWCAVCDLPFTESSFVRYPNGVVAHLHCATNKHICPVTGKLFMTQSTQPPDK